MISWEKQIENDLSWREAEIATLKKQTVSAPSGSDRYTALLRALWCMLYAHYEGFTKFCWDLLLETIEAEGVKRENLTTPFLELSLETDCKKLRFNSSTASLVQFMRSSYPMLLSSNATFAAKLETQSNLWCNVFEEECSKVSLTSMELNKHRAKLNALVARRNDIAHGKRMVIKTLAEYQPYEEAVLLVMHELAVQVVDCLEQKTYLEY